MTKEEMQALLRGLAPGIRDLVDQAVSKHTAKELATRDREIASLRMAIRAQTTALERLAGRQGT